MSSPRSLLAADPDQMVRTLRALIDECDRERARLGRELQQWLTAAGRRPGDGSDQPALFEARAQPELWGST